MRLADAGERAAIAAIRAVLGLEGPGDDCARVPLPDGAAPDDAGTLVATTDLVLAPSHFPDVMTPLQRGAYAAAVNLSDLASCGARPAGMLVSFGLPPHMELPEVEEVARGLATMADRHGCPVLGGDTKPSGDLLLAGFALGWAAGDGMPRSAARPGHALMVTGHLGGAALGYERWRESGAARTGGDGGTEDGPALDRLLVPAPRVPEGRALAAAGAVACMDLSDGLAYSLHRMAEAAGVGVRVEAGAVPRFPEADLGHALLGAGDFELVCAIPEDAVGEAVAEVEAVGGTLTRIGEVVEEGEGAVLVGEGGAEEPLEERGFEHFGAGTGGSS